MLDWQTGAELTDYLDGHWKDAVMPDIRTSVPWHARSQGWYAPPPNSGTKPPPPPKHAGRRGGQGPAESLAHSSFFERARTGDGDREVGGAKKDPADGPRNTG
jgi:hypothetical protein